MEPHKLKYAMYMTTSTKLPELASGSCKSTSGGPSERLEIGCELAGTPKASYVIEDAINVKGRHRALAREPQCGIKSKPQQTTSYSSSSASGQPASQ